MSEICLSEVGLLDWGKSQSGVGERQSSRFSNLFPNPFLGIYWGKNLFFGQIRKLNSCLGLGEKRKEERKGEKLRFRQERQAFGVEFVGGHPY